MAPTSPWIGPDRQCTLTRCARTGTVRSDVGEADDLLDGGRPGHDGGSADAGSVPVGGQRVSDDLGGHFGRHVEVLVEADDGAPVDLDAHHRALGPGFELTPLGPTLGRGDEDYYQVIDQEGQDRQKLGRQTTSRIRVSATQAGRPLPSISTVTFSLSLSPLGVSATPASSETTRTLDPTGTGETNRTRSKP